MLNHRVRWIFLLSLPLVSFGLWTSCTISHSQKPNLLIIAVEGLGVNDINCSREPKALSQSGLDLLCKNSVRFTHAYTPSLMSQSALASLFTGLYPFEHGVHNNGSDYLKVNFPSFAKVAAQKGYHTGFFSGGPPALRSSGLQQGFETFDDNVYPTIKKLFRPADLTFTAFHTWSKEVEAPFLSVIFVPDLLFQDVETVDEFGEKRNLTRDSQIDNLDLNLSTLFAQMKKDKSWDQTTIFLVGLNGPSEKLPELNLHSERTQVSLLVKAARNPRDEGLSWSYDDPVSLVDVGRTIFEMLESTPEKKSILPAYSFSQEIKKPGLEKKPDRWIYSESYWGPWKKKADPVFSLRKNNILAIQDWRWHFYNTLTDRMESSEIPSSDSSITGISAEMEAVKKLIQLPPASGNKNFLSENQSSPTEQALDLVQQNNWPELSLLGTKNKRDDWIALAERNLGITKTGFSNSCLQLMDDKSPSQNERRLCADPQILLLSDFLTDDERREEPVDHPHKEFYRKKISQILKNEMLFSRLVTMNEKISDIWNVSEKRKASHLNFELAWHHPRLRQLRQQLQ